jgi:hypothetical protein
MSARIFSRHAANLKELGHYSSTVLSFPSHAFASEQVE